MCKEKIEVWLPFAPNTIAPIMLDKCIAPLVVGLNENGFYTVTSTCGHGEHPGSIEMASGQVMVLAPDRAAADLAETAMMEG